MIRGDKYGYRARIGYTSPPLTSEVFPYEFYKVVPDGVSLVITTLAITVRSDSEVSQSYDISMKAAEQMAEAGCNAIVLGGVPINLARGVENAAQMIKDLEKQLGIPVATSASAQKEAFRLLGCKKLVVAHPYKAEDNHRFDDYAKKFGAEVLGTRAWGSDFNKIGGIPDDAALKMARDLMKATSRRRHHHVPLAALAGDQRHRAAGGGVRRHRHVVDPGDPVAGAASCRNQGLDLRLRPPVQGFLSP